MSTVPITQDNFQSLVLEADGPVLLDFWASWCGPCRMIAPTVEAIAQDRPDVLVGKIDVDQESQLAAAFGIVSIPTLVVLRKGQITARAVGYQSREALEKLLEA